MIKRSISWFKFKRQMSTISTKTQRNRTAERSPDWNTIEANFRFTRGRFVRNEAFEMSQRYIPFDMNELSRIAAEAVGSESCLKVEKYPDGMFNKTFLFTMNNGTQVAGKVPNPNAGRPHFTTASEVATIDFACSPIPDQYESDSVIAGPKYVQ